MMQSNPGFSSDPFQERRAPAGAPAASARPESAAPQADANQVPVLGKTLLFRGELTAEEDVILQGRVEGSIRHARNLTIGSEGSVQGDVYASHLTVEGLVEGDLHCSEGVVVLATAQVRGNIFAPRVGIMEGALFNGRIEMDPGAAAARSGNSRPASRPATAPQRSGAAAPPAPQTRAGGVATSAASPAPTPAAGGALGGPDVDQMLSTPRPNRK